MELIHSSQLPFVGTSHEFAGAEHGGLGASFFLVITEGSQGTRLHKHNYDEIVYVIAGRSKWVVGTEEREASSGDVLVVRAGEPHKFINAGDKTLRQIDIQ